MIEKIFPTIKTRAKNKDKKISLTFDDVPYDKSSKIFQEIVSLLDEYNYKATFFVIADNNFMKNKHALINSVKNGHHLANHGTTNSMHALKSNKSLETEIEDCSNRIYYIYDLAKIKKPDTMYYRPGCGMVTNSMIKLAKDCDTTIALGSVYQNDPVMCFPYINYLYLISHIESGDVVILHDRKWTVPMLKMLLKWMKQNDYKSVTLDKLFEN